MQTSKLALHPISLLHHAALLLCCHAYSLFMKPHVTVILFPTPLPTSLHSGSQRYLLFLGTPYTHLELRMEWF